MNYLVFYAVRIFSSKPVLSWRPARCLPFGVSARVVSLMSVHSDDQCEMSCSYYLKADPSKGPEIPLACWLDVKQLANGILWLQRECCRACTL